MFLSHATRASDELPLHTVSLAYQLVTSKVTGSRSLLSCHNKIEFLTIFALLPRLQGNTTLHAYGMVKTIGMFTWHDDIYHVVSVQNTHFSEVLLWYVSFDMSEKGNPVLTCHDDM